MTPLSPTLCEQPSPDVLRRLIDQGPTPAAAQPLLSLQGKVGLRVERMHFPGAKPVQVQIRAFANGDVTEVLIGEWVGTQASDVAQAEADRLAKPRRGQGTPHGTAITSDLAHGLVLRRPGFDARLPGLRLLHDAAFARDQLPRLGCAADARVELVAHRLGKRAVLRISGAQGVYYARLRPVTSGSGAAGYAQHLALWQALAGAPGLAVPRPLAFDAPLGLALFARLPGVPPVFRGLDGFRAAQAVMEALHALQILPIDAPLHTAQDELAVLNGWIGRVQAVFPHLATLVAEPLARLHADMAALRPLPPVPCHRDLHEGQILLDQTLAGFLDFDTLRRGDPAMDVGNLQAHLFLAGLRDGLARGAFCTAMDRCLPRLPLARISVWRRAALLRLALIYAVTAEPRAIIHGLIAEAR